MPPRVTEVSVQRWSEERRKAAAIESGRLCKIDGCHEPYRRREMCGRHYEQARKAEQTLVCQIEACDGPEYSRGYCGAHYAKARRKGEFGGLPCSVEGCTRYSSGRRLCSLHYSQALRRGDFGVGVCAVRGCPQPAHLSELCSSHKGKRGRYGLTVDELSEIEAEYARGALCRICQVNVAVHIDHCHSTGRFRALLCQGCNVGLGVFEESPERMRAAALYIEGYRMGADE